MYGEIHPEEVKLKHRPQNASDPKLPALLYGYLDDCAIHCLLDCCGINSLELSVETATGMTRCVGFAAVDQMMAELDAYLAMLQTREEPLHCLTDMWLPSHLHLWLTECRAILAEGIRVAKVEHEAGREIVPPDAVFRSVVYDDRESWSILADWLDEQGDRRSIWVREFARKRATLKELTWVLCSYRWVKSSLRPWLSESDDPGGKFWNPVTALLWLAGVCDAKTDEATPA